MKIENPLEIECLATRICGMVGLKTMNHAKKINKSAFCAFGVYRNFSAAHWYILAWIPRFEKSDEGTLPDDNRSTNPILNPEVYQWD